MKARVLGKGWSLTFGFSFYKLLVETESRVRGERAMKTRRGNWLVVLPALVVLASWPVIWAQEKTPEKPKDQAAAQVPPDVSKKAREYKGSPVPPKKLTKVADGHWTPYTPPEVPKDAEVYKIKQGDTLSGIAQQKLGTWLLWPQIWDANPYIKDAHWIYPDDPLFIKTPKVVGMAGEEVPVQEEGTSKGSGMQIEEEAPMPPVNAHDVYCSGFIVQGYHFPTLHIVTSTDRARESLAQGDVVYLNGGTAEGIENGSEFTIIQKGQTVSNPVTGKALGTIIQRMGRVKVVSSQEHSSIAQITMSCDEIRYGFGLIPYKPIPIPWDIKASEELPIYLPESGKPTGRVVWAEDRLESVGRFNIAYIDLGANQKLAPGDKLWIYRYADTTLLDTTNDLFRQQKIDVGEKDLFRDKKSSAATAADTRLPSGTTGVAETSGSTATSSDTRIPSGDASKAAQGAAGYRKFLGEAVVLTTEPNTACVKLLLSSEDIHPGDYVQVE